MTLPDLSKVDRFSRRQPGLYMYHLWPTRDDGLCACGCGEKLERRRTRWASDACSIHASETYQIVCGHSSHIRPALHKRDRGICVECDRECTGSAWHDGLMWEADHVTPVHLGGGGCLLGGYQTLCEDCHKAKTARNARRRAHERRMDNKQAVLEIP